MQGVRAIVSVSGSVSFSFQKFQQRNLHSDSRSHLFCSVFVFLLQLQLRNRYLDVPIDKRMYLNPTTTH